MFIAIDGDNIGSELEKLVILGDTQKITEYSNSFNKTITQIKNYVLDRGYMLIFCGGDSLLFKAHKFNANEELPKILKYHYPFSFSVGVGETTLEAYLALNIAKSSGKKCWISYKNLTTINPLEY